MKTFLSPLALVTVLTFAAGNASCGSGNHLVSIAVRPNPASIFADSSSGVQLEAIGTFSNGNTAILPSANWSSASPGYSVTNTGLATCSLEGPIPPSGAVSASVGTVSGTGTLNCFGNAV